MRQNRSLGQSGLLAIQKLPRRQNANVLDGRRQGRFEQSKKVLIACHDDASVAVYGALQYPVVVRISSNKVQMRSWVNVQGSFPERLTTSADVVVVQSKFLFQSLD